MYAGTSCKAPFEYVEDDAGKGELYVELSFIRGSLAVSKGLTSYYSYL